MFTNRFIVSIILIACYSCSGHSSGGGGTGGIHGSNQLELVKTNISERIPPNIVLNFEFNKNLLEQSINSQTVRFFNEKSGKEVSGWFKVEGKRFWFYPNIHIKKGNIIYSFLPGETYKAILRKDGIKGSDYGTLNKDFVIKFSISQKPVDLDGKNPEVQLLNPKSLEGINVSTKFIFEFSEFVNPLPLINGEGIISSIRKNGAEWKNVFLNKEIIFDQKKRTTIVTLFSSKLYPSNGRIRIKISSSVKDLSGKPCKEKEFLFTTQRYLGEQLVIKEDFSSDDFCDNLGSGAIWGKDGKPGLKPGILGGPGLLGDFYPENEETVIFTHDYIIKGDKTLIGVPYFVKNGIFFFQSFIVPESAKVVFKGVYPVKLYVSGCVRILGKVIVDGSDAPPHSGVSYNPVGGNGGIGGPGAGHGGKGGCQPYFGKVAGEDGQDVCILMGHPKYKNRIGTKGKGAPGHPKSGKWEDLIYKKVGGKEICFMLAAGGGGGGFWKKGGNGKVVKVINPSVNKGSDGIGGELFPVFPLVSGYPNWLQFLVGGSGGGGGGAHPYYYVKNSYESWRTGGGGGGWGGAILFRVGRDFYIGKNGLISAKGGSGSSKNKYYATPGGGGSGGSIVIQCGGIFTLDGKIDVSGGKGGVYRDIEKGIEVIGGNGSQGFLRVETKYKLTLEDLKGVLPSPQKESLGILKEFDPISSGRSKFYEIKSFCPQFVRFEIETQEGQIKRIYSDDPNYGILPGYGVTPVCVFLQIGQKDKSGKITLKSPWTQCSKNLNQFITVGDNLLRFTIILDRSAIGNEMKLTVKNIKIYYIP